MSNEALNNNLQDYYTRAHHQIVGEMLGLLLNKGYNLDAAIQVLKDLDNNLLRDLSLAKELRALRYRLQDARPGWGLKYVGTKAKAVRLLGNPMTESQAKEMAEQINNNPGREKTLAEIEEELNKCFKEI